jgi:hypothetical protein
VLCDVCANDLNPIRLDEIAVLSEINVNKIVARMGRQFIKKEEAIAAVKEFARFVVLKNRLGDFEGRLLSPSPLVSIWSGMS